MAATLKRCAKPFFADIALHCIEAALKKIARDTYLPFELLKTKNQEEIVTKK